MYYEMNIEELLHRAPQPVPPAGLLTELERQIQIPEPEPKPSWGDLLRRFWVPAAGFAGAAAALALVVTLWQAGTTRSLAQSFEALTRVKSFRVIERVRSGPSQAVFKDKSKPKNLWPNYSTTLHPNNPFEETQHWFKADPQALRQGKIRTLGPRTETLRSGNRVLEIDRQTGQRKFKLNSAGTMFASVASPVAANLNTPLAEAVADVPGLTPEIAATVWVGESRWQVNGDEQIMRFWINRTNHLPVRIQVWGTEFPEIAPEVLKQEWEFSDFDADVPEETLEFDVMDTDLAPLGITREEFEKLPDDAFSVRVTGEQGAAVSGTVKDGSGTREIKGTLPLSFVHSPVGEVSMKFRFPDGQRHDIGLSINDMNMSTAAPSILGTVHPDGSISAEGGR